MKLLRNLAFALGLAATVKTQAKVPAPRLQEPRFRAPRFKRRSRRLPDWAWCPQCQNTRSNNGKHRCIAPYIPAPRHGWRYQDGKLVRRRA